MGSSGDSLTGISVLVTRPKQQADRLAQLIRAAGGDPILFPCLEIVHDSAHQKALQQVRLDCIDIALFTSANAVYYAFQTIKSLPNQLMVLAVGQATQAALFHVGIKQPVLVPSTDAMRSEGLLALAVLQQIASTACVIFTGENPRPLLANELQRRGAAVTVVPVYKRCCPTDKPTSLPFDPSLQSLIVTSTSVESLRYLSQVSDPCFSQLIECPLVVLSERIKTVAGRLGWKSIHVTNYPGDRGIYTACVNIARF